MPLISELRVLVIDAIQDPSITTTQVDALLNRGIRFISGKVLLPELEAKSTVDTAVDGTPVAMPTDYQRNLFGCTDGVESVGIHTSVALMRRRYPNLLTDFDNGLVTDVCVSARNLIYQPVPDEATTLTLWYYKKPAVVAADAAPDLLPEDLHEELLFSFAMWKLEELIEDGIEGQKINTAYYKQAFYEALAELKLQIKAGQSRPEPQRDKGWI